MYSCESGGFGVVWSIPAQQSKTTQNNQTSSLISFRPEFFLSVDVVVLLRSVKIHAKLVRLASVTITCLSRGLLIWQMVLIIKGHTHAPQHTHAPHMVIHGATLLADIASNIISERLEVLSHNWGTL